MMGGSTDSGTSPKPTPIRMSPENIPDILKGAHQWVAWRYLPKDGKWTKPPFRVDGNGCRGHASSTDPDTWSDFPAALIAYQNGSVDGIGIALTPDMGIVGVDLDHCYNRETKAFESWATAVIDHFNSYTETSPSGTGVRIFLRGELPAGGRKKGNIEIYSSGRYLTVTGRVLRNRARTLELRQSEIDAFLAEHFPPEPKIERRVTTTSNGYSDDELLDKAFAAINGGKIQALFNGDISAYASQSEADLALCSLLDFWAQDPAQLDRFFRRSALMRDKWDEKHGAVTYGERTIERAWASTTEHYSGEHPTSNHADSTAAYPYGIEDGRIVRYQTVKEGQTISQSLCNFVAEIKEEVVLDDGADPQRAFLIEGRLDTKAMLPETRVAVARFPSMNWVGESWGRRAIVNAGNSTKDHLRVAIQKLSPNARDRYIFTHTGWRKIGSRWIYLSGSTTGNSDFEVDLGTELMRYRMPTIVGDHVSAMKLSLSLLKVAPLRIMAPLFAACFRAPLCGAYPQDLSIWLEGRTGSLKSSLAALLLNHFGEFNRVTLPGNWESTANQLERRAFLLKDSLFVIDEYVPTGLNRREIETKASRILRGQGNLSGRNRLKSDLSERPAFYPRGIIISTGEEHPPGQSLLARTIVIELSRDDIDIDLLTGLQQQAGRFAHAMAGYIDWLTPQMDNLPALLKETFLGTRAKATTGNEHLRIPEAAAHLWLGVHSALTYAQEIGAVGSKEADKILDDCWVAFIQIGKDQTVLVEEEQPVRRFLSVLYTMVTQGRAIIRDKAEAIPDPKPGVDFIGWSDPDYLYLLPEATFQAVARFCHDTGDHLPRSERLKRDLKKDRISECDDDRLTKRVRIGNHLPRVLQLNIGVIEKAFGIEGWL
jgi:hypothetical protein